MVLDLNEKVCGSVQEVFDCLELGNSMWKHAGYGDLGFRGQGNSLWPLMARAFRSETSERLEARGSLHVGDMVRQAKAEYEKVRKFVELADRVGLALPGDLHYFRTLADKSGTDEVKYWGEIWPCAEVLQVLALAQHHGVPTRLLDFTYLALVALWFAAKGATDDAECFSVWVIDLRFIRQVWGRSPDKERIRIVEVPRAGNDFIRAQHGLFLLDGHVSREWANGVESLDHVMLERARYWNGQAGAWSDGRAEEKFVLPITRIDTPCGLAGDTLARLHRVGINSATLKPSYGDVVKALSEVAELERKIVSGGPVLGKKEV